MPDHTNDLRAHALHQKSKEPPEVPRITAEEAIDLRAEASRSIDHDYFHSLLERKLISSWSSLGFHAVAIDVTTLGRAALARYEAEREREIRKPLVDLLDDIYDRLEDYVDVVDGEDRPSPNFAMSIRTSIDVALGRQP